MSGGNFRKKLADTKQQILSSKHCQNALTLYI